MAINSKLCVCIGSTYFEVAQELFAAIKSFENVAGEGVIVTSNNAYEYMQVTLGDNTYRMCFNAYKSNSQLRGGIADTSSTGGNMPYYINLNGTTTPTAQLNRPDSKIFSYARLFYDDENNFIGTTGLYINSGRVSPWCLFSILNDEYVFLLHGYGSAYDPLTQNSYYFADYSQINMESPDTIFLSNYYAQIEYEYLPVKDFFIVKNNALYTYNYTHDTNGFIIIGTEDGNYMHLSNDAWILYGSSGSKEVYEYGV